MSSIESFRKQTPIGSLTTESTEPRALYYNDKEDLNLILTEINVEGITGINSWIFLQIPTCHMEYYLYSKQDSPTDRLMQRIDFHQNYPASVAALHRFLFW